MSLFHCVMIGPSNRKNWLIFGGALVPDTYAESLFHFPRHFFILHCYHCMVNKDSYCEIGDFMRFIIISYTVIARFLRNFAKWLMPSTILLFDIEQVPRSMLTGDKFIFIIRYRHPLVVLVPSLTNYHTVLQWSTLQAFKGSPTLDIERWGLRWFRSIGSQPAGDLRSWRSHKPDGFLPLLCPASITLCPVSNYTDW